MQFSTMLSDVRSRVIEATAAFFSDAEINRWLNLGYKDFIARTEWTQKVKAYAVVANQHTYDLPSDLIKIELVTWQDKYRVMPKDEDEFRAVVGASPNRVSIRPNYYVAHPFDKRIRIYPGPSAASASTAANGGENSTATTIDADSVASFSGMGRLITGSEQVYYYATATGQFLQCVRGADYTTAATIDDEATISQGDLLLHYRYQPPDLSGASDEPRIPEVWQESLILYACHVAMQKRKNWEASNNYMKEYLRVVDQANAERRRQQLDKQFVIKDEDNDPGVYDGSY